MSTTKCLSDFLGKTCGKQSDAVCELPNSTILARAGVYNPRAGTFWFSSQSFLTFRSASLSAFHESSKSIMSAIPNTRSVTSPTIAGVIRKDLVDANKVVVHEVRADRGSVVLQFLRERIGQSGEPAMCIRMVEVLAFHLAGRYVARVRPAAEINRRGIQPPGAAVRASWGLSGLSDYRDRTRVLQLNATRKSICGKLKMSHYRPEQS
jgi:hypothetical protein